MIPFPDEQEKPRRGEKGKKKNCPGPIEGEEKRGGGGGGVLNRRNQTESKVEDETNAASRKRKKGRRGRPRWEKPERALYCHQLLDPNESAKKKGRRGGRREEREKREFHMARAKNLTISIFRLYRHRGATPPPPPEGGKGGELEESGGPAVVEWRLPISAIVFVRARG